MIALVLFDAAVKVPILIDHFQSRGPSSDRLLQDGLGAARDEASILADGGSGGGNLLASHEFGGLEGAGTMYPIGIALGLLH